MISALIAYRETRDECRDDAWRLVVQPYLENVCGEVIVESPGPGEDADDFNKPAAINRARERANGDVLLIGDADTYPGDVISMQYLLLRHWQRTAWVLPQLYTKLTRAATRDWLHGPARAGKDSDYEWVGNGVSWSGGVLVRADDFDLVGGYDERYRRWGADDVAFGLTMNALIGPVERHPCSSYHFWHPVSAARADSQPELTSAYMAAAGDADAISLVRWPE
jgi:hypothetical protein